MKKTTYLELKDRQEKDWSKWSSYWKLLVECSRPSADDLHTCGQIINNHISGISDPVIVILGSTPEYRDLCTAYAHQYGAKVICVELVKDMYLAMTDLLFAHNDEEEVIFSNWLDIDLPENHADIVIGDLTEGNIEGEFKQKYLAEVKRILKQNGKYITRHTSYIDENEAKPMVSQSDLESLLDEYKEDVLNGKLTLQQAGNYLGAKMAWESYYKTNGEKISPSVYNDDIETISSSIESDPIKAEIVRIMKMIWGPIMDKFWEYYPLEETVSNFKKLFADVKYHYSEDYPIAKYTPIFEMVKGEN